MQFYVLCTMAIVTVVTFCTPPGAASKCDQDLLRCTGAASMSELKAIGIALRAANKTCCKSNLLNDCKVS